MDHRSNESIRFATFDDHLWLAAGAEGFEIFHNILPSKFLKKQ
jgi:hypothetical protein